MKKKYKIGDLIAVPINKGFGLGIIASESDNILLCYFFSPLYEELPKVDDVLVSKNNIVLITRCSNLGLLKGKWVVVGQLNSFNQKDWNDRLFKRQDVLSKEVYVIKYSDELKEIDSWVPEDESSVIGYPEDGLAGSVFVEKKLSKIVNS